MYNLLSKQGKRLIKIVDELILVDDWVTLDTLSAQLNATKRTIANDISYIRYQWDNVIDIETSTKLGIKINSFSTDAFKTFILDIYNSQLAIKWLETIFLFPNKPISFYSEYLYTSVSTLARLLKELNKGLSKYGLNVTNTGNIYIINARSEEHLREFFSYFFIEIGYEVHSFEGINFTNKEITNIIDNYIFFDYTLHNLQRMFYGMLFVISTIREKQGFELEYDQDSTYDLSYFDDLQITLSTKSKYTIHKFVLSQQSPLDKKFTEKLNNERELFINALFNEFDFRLSLEKREEIRQTLDNLLFSYYKSTYELAVFFNRYLFFNLFFKRNNSYSFNIVKKHFQIFCDRTGVDFTSMFPSITYWLSIAYPKINNYFGVKKIIIFSDFGDEHADYIADLLNLHFNKSNDGKLIIMSDEVENMSDYPNFDNFDLVIATLLPENKDEMKFYLINDYLTHKNLYEITHLLTN